MKTFLATATCISFASLTVGCGSSGGGTQAGAPGGTSPASTIPTQILRYPIDPDVQTTLQRTITYPAASGLALNELCEISEYDRLGYGTWSYGPPLGCEKRKDIMPPGYAYPPAGDRRQLLHFFAMTDIHITDKEAPNQLIYLQQTANPRAQIVTSIYSGVMLYTTHVLDAAIQTVNLLHRTNPFDFGISLGDASNTSAFIELRWYIDVIDGKVITPSSGAHLGADTIDYQMPYQAAGLDRSISWYQTIGNHDKFFIGSFPVYHYPDPSFSLLPSYTSSQVLAGGDVFSPQGGALNIMNPANYLGVLDGSTPDGTIAKAGPVGGFGTPPTVAPDPNRRPLTNVEWVAEFFNTTSQPVGHGFNLVDPGHEPGFACYSFVPKSNVPLKVIVLDDNQLQDDGSYDIHGHAYLDEARWTWLKKELANGDAAGQLMIIAAHIPIAVSPLGSELEWWRPDLDPYIGAPVPGDGRPTVQNAVTLAGLVAELQSHPNFLLWIAGHRHTNTVKAFPGPTPEQGFWQVETSSLRDYPQNFRTFEINLHRDYSISVVATDVDPSFREGTPAATSRKYAIAAQQVIQTPGIYQNPSQLIDLDTQQVVSLPDGSPSPDPSIRPMPTGMYNAELFKKLSPAMILKLQSLYPFA